MKLTFVTPWYGRDLSGGAETLTRQLLQQLQQADFAVEVLTTCIRDSAADWGHNQYKSGLEIVDDIPVRRFQVEKRNKETFDQINWQLMQGLTISQTEETLFTQEMFHCPHLFAYIAEQKEDTLFIFIPYLFTTTTLGAQIWPERSLIIPCLHDEGYAYLHVQQQVMTKVRGLIFLAEAEQALANKLYPAADGQIRTVIGAGVHTNWQGNGRRFREKYGLADTPLMLYVGRRQVGKNTPLLTQYWLQYLQQSGRQAKLILMGPGEIQLSSAADAAILDLGFVSRQDKYDAYAAADVFCMPSVHESFSIVIMESWLAGTPVLVHGQCAVTKEHCQKANGGLYFTDFLEFAAMTDFLLENKETAVTLGQQGKKYVLQNFQWDTIMARYTEVINQLIAEVERGSNG